MNTATVSQPISIDLFCRVIDNLGDIGVCWRLARQLATRPEVAQLRLWVDDLHSFSRIQSEIQSGLQSQRLQGVDIEHWHDARQDYPAPHPFVIEAFACEPPETITGQLKADSHVWINLDYLSAEPWVQGCHGLPSPQAGGANKYFFFPGFVPQTGGLLRESDLLARRDTFLKDDTAYQAMLNRVGVAQEHIQALLQGEMQQMFLFCYPDAPVLALPEVLSTLQQKTLLLVPESVAQRIPPLEQGHLLVQRIPAVNQADFDALLWRSALNIVRGEDSLVRAIWAGQPMLWQPYVQEEQAHLDKLQAWLDTGNLPEPVQALHLAWSSADQAGAAAALSRSLEPQVLRLWQQEARAYSAKLAEQADLASSLLSFYTQVARKR
ncbi:elongation factor P maturation arginine rhamnosyltransferase EarP [Alcaligenes faecalis]|uniref:elongation factor P maturation arginine rhamnosyltransferase EarP n=1 Tax=Alcaligenes faecalis TaxID=511 RepID=UPI0013DD9BD2|nr:elongation factor P maturation arginine rhamnosyltransferase EarP [Alcaligenes faecalis]